MRTRVRRPRVGPPRKAKGRRFYHHDDYAFNDSILGVLAAIALGYDWIDLNFHVTKDGVVVCTHWAQPMRNGWFDPLHKLNSNLHVWEMTFAEISRLRYHADPKLRISSAGAILRFCAGRINVEFEAKNSPQFATSAPWDRLDVMRGRNPKLVMEVKMLTTFTALWRPTLKQAYDHWWTTMLLVRHEKVTKKCWPYTCIVRPKPKEWVA
jgi:glycerophosphoryl diester phosphodiesterase